MVIPFPHERKMVLNKVRNNYKYFYTRCDVLVKEEQLYKVFVKTGDQTGDQDEKNGKDEMILWNEDTTNPETW